MTARPGPTGIAWTPGVRAATIAGRLRRLAADATGPPASAGQPGGGRETGLRRAAPRAGSGNSAPWWPATSGTRPCRSSARWARSCTGSTPSCAERLTRVLIGSVIKAVQDMDWHEARLAGRPVLPRGPAPGDRPALESTLGDGLGRASCRARRRDPLLDRVLEDLRTIEAFSPAERALAQAMIWNHIAGLHREEVDDLHR